MDCTSPWGASPPLAALGVPKVLTETFDQGVSGAAQAQGLSQAPPGYSGDHWSEGKLCGGTRPSADGQPLRTHWPQASGCTSVIQGLWVTVTQGPHLTAH